ncbi:MAG: TonB-dependent receptor [Burkholderiaceae bacterium]
MKSKRRWRAVVCPVLVVLSFFTVRAYGQTTSPAPDASPETTGDQKLEKITVTGSNIRRTDTETPSVVQVITADDMKKSGYTSVADVLHNITANNMGSLTQANPAAFAAGGAGVSLRGLTVGGTLVLIDGHRMAPYPMPDDGERSFVDIASIPFDAVERIEVLKDGASSVYGSDAIAGVVNVILKKTYVGTTVSVEAGASYKGDGQTQHASAFTGWGDLDNDGYNAYVGLEYRYQNQILLSSRPYLTNTNWTSQGGVNLTQGINNQTVVEGLPGSITGYLVNPANPINTITTPNGSTLYEPAPIYSYPGCTSAQLIAGQCGYVNKALTIQPQTQNIDLISRFTKKLEDDWQFNVQGSLLNSQAQQAGVYNATAPLGFFGLTTLNFGPNVNPPVPYSPGNFPYVITVPANYPGNPLGRPAGLIYDFPDLGAQKQQTNTTSYRLVGELTGSYRDWDLSASVGVTSVVTNLENINYISISGLQTALNNLSYIVGGHNSQQVLNQIAPVASHNSTSDLDFITLRASHDLWNLPGGPLSFGTGIDFEHTSLDEEFPSSFANGDQASPIYSFAVGDQNVTAIYGELVAPILKNLEVDASARVDHYGEFGNSTTPKVGFKYAPIQEFTVRGTYSQGFRAPNVAESGNAGSTSGVLNAATNPLTGQLIYVPNIQLSNPNLKPEKSDSYTFGFIFEPNRIFNASVDYYNIDLKNQIISVGLLGENQYLYPQLYGVKFYPNLLNIAYDTYPFINASQTRTDGIDVDLEGKFSLGEFGKLKADFQLTRMFQYSLTLPQLGTFQLAGTHGPSFISGDTGTPRNRATFVLDWTSGPWDVTGTVNYVDSYSVLDTSYGETTCANTLEGLFNGAQPPSNYCRVASFTTFNLNASYHLTKNWELHGSIINLFNRNAPYDLTTFGSAGNGAGTGGAPYDPALAQDGAVGRFFSIGARYTY